MCRPEVFLEGPFHLFLDRDLVLVQIGDGLRKRLGRRDGLWRPTPLLEHLSIVSPHIKCTFQGILTMLNTQFIIRIKQGLSGADSTGQVGRDAPAGARELVPMTNEE